MFNWLFATTVNAPINIMSIGNPFITNLQRMDFERCRDEEHFGLGKLAFYSDNFLLNRLTRDDNLPILCNKHVDFQTHAKFARKIDARFYGKAGFGDDFPLIMGFEIVDVRPVPMDLFADIMSRPVDETLGIAFRGNIFSLHVIDIAATRFVSGGEFLLEIFYRCIARTFHDLKNFLILGGNSLAGKCHPRDIGVDSARLSPFRPKIDQDAIAFLYLREYLLRRFIMGICSTTIHRTIWRVREHENIFLEILHHALLNVVLRHFLFRPQFVADKPEGHINSLAEYARYFELIDALLVRPSRFKILDDVG